MAELYQRVLEFTGDGVYRYAFDDGQILFANQGLVKILGLDCTAEELVGRYLKDVLIYTEAPATVRHQLEAEGEIHNFEYHFRTLKGEDKWVLHDSFIRDDAETGQRIVEAIVKDITFRKQAEAELAREQEWLRVTLRSIGDGVIATDTAGRITLINEVAELLTGWPQEEALGRPLVEVFRILNEQTRAPAVNPVEKVLESGLVIGLANHTSLLARDGTERSIADSGAPIRDRQGKLVGVVLVFRDITERKRTEGELRQHREQLEELVSQRTAELARSNAELEQFASVASHDLQEPLRMVASYVELLQRRYHGRLDAEADEFIRYAAEGARRMQRLIRDLLAYSRVGRPGKPFQSTDCGRVLETVLANLQISIGESGAQVTVDPLPVVHGEQTELVQLFQNLVGNAIKFHGSRPPQVHVSARRRDSQWVFEVRDNGIGIEPREADRIFQIFQRLHTRPEYPGTGIGLAICKKIVERHGGAIWVESQPGEGSTFVFTLEAAKRRAASSGPDAEPD